ncbi:PCI-domain-containing protein [Rhizophagus clarus]|uniref:PCI-domain-containing protein n=1 Tax=Rhizophagus clarus TaxID=94130 RepID=A0A8H3QIP1_9GLOM|nr:PCI-domain-containing protein [Rhizophagus clarus]
MATYQQDTKMDLDQNPIEVLNELRKQCPPDLQEYLNTFEDLYDRKLWHQLTLKIEEFFSIPASGPFQVPLFQHFISDWENRMNKLKLVTLGLSVVKQFSDNHQALVFLTSLVEKVNTPDTSDAYVHAVMETAYTKLLLGDFEGTKNAIDECEKILDKFDSVETVIHASFYRVCAEYFKAKANFPEFYKSALLYLACINLDVLTPDEKTNRAYDLAISALLGETIYNFGELLMHPILDALIGTPHEWLRTLLFAYNVGDLAKYETLSVNFAQMQLLQDNIVFLRQKICLMSLIEAVFQRNSDNRTISFSTICSVTLLPPEEVEYLIMKALSLKLIRGSIDQVREVVMVTWVQPRVLDLVQIDGMRQRLQEWDENVKKTAVIVENETPELFVQ